MPELLPNIVGWITLLGMGVGLQTAFTVALEKQPAWRFWSAFWIVLVRSLLNTLLLLAALAAIWLGTPLVSSHSDATNAVKVYATAAALIGVAIAHYIYVIRKISRPPA